MIRASGQSAKLLRRTPGERLYGSDDEVFAEVATFPIEFVETPPEELARSIDATASTLPDLDVTAEDRVRTDEGDFRVQTVVIERLFGIPTHKTLKLVRLHDGPTIR